MQIPQELQNKIERIVADSGFVIFQMKFIVSSGNRILRLLIDDEFGGITINECAQINRALSALLEEEQFLNENYTIEVCSPGLDWPLREKKDFQRALDRKVHLYLKEIPGVKRELVGMVKEVLDDGLIIDVDNDSLEIKYDNINKGQEEY